MARNYKPLVQVGFRTSNETKEFLTEKAKSENKTVSDLCAAVVEEYFIHEQTAKKIGFGYTPNTPEEKNVMLELGAKEHKKEIDKIKKQHEKEIDKIEKLIFDLYFALRLPAPMDNHDIEQNLSTLVKSAEKKRLTFQKQED